MYNLVRNVHEHVHVHGQEVNVANQWYKNNGTIVNEKKHQALILGKTEHNFCFPVNNSIDIFGMTTDIIIGSLLITRISHL